MPIRRNKKTEHGLGFNVPTADWEPFAALCKEMDISATKALIKFIRWAPVARFIPGVVAIDSTPQRVPGVEHITDMPRQKSSRT
jgi:hypothetical protein